MGKYIRKVPRIFYFYFVSRRAQFTFVKEPLFVLLRKSKVCTQAANLLALAFCNFCRSESRVSHVRSLLKSCHFEIRV